MRKYLQAISIVMTCLALANAVEAAEDVRSDPSAEFRDRRPDILWITAEDLSPALGCYGYPENAIPVLVAALRDENLATVQHAARKIELLGEKAKAAVPAMKTCDSRMKQIRPPGTSPLEVEPDKDKAMFVLFSELIDLDGTYARRKGLLAFQDHGKDTLVYFKDIRLKHLSEGGGDR